MRKKEDVLKGVVKLHQDELETIEKMIDAQIDLWDGEDEIVGAEIMIKLGWWPINWSVIKTIRQKYEENGWTVVFHGGHDDPHFRLYF